MPDEPFRNDTIAQPDILVGREPEQAILRAAVDDVVAGRSRLLLVAGPPGMGKTRIAEELARRAHERDLRVLWGRCYEEEGAPPFWPWVQILRAALKEIGEHESGPRADLAELVPELRGDSAPDQPAGADSPQARFRLFEAVAGLLERLSTRAPVVVILDDLHGADPSSLRLLEFIARGERAPLLLLGCYRDGLAPDHPLMATIAEALRLPRAMQITLRGLGATEVEEFIERTAGVSPAPAVVATVHERTEGNPLYVKEYVRLLLAERIPIDAANGDVARWLQVPPGVRAVVGRRIAPLSAACQRMLSAAAVIGREFGVDVLRQLDAGATGAAVEEVLEEARRAALVIDGLRPGTCRFAHAVIRESLYADLGTVQRARLHGRIAEVLEHRADRDEHLTELARHFLESRRDADVAKGVAYAREAGRRATALLAYEEAVRLDQMALAALEPMGSSGDRIRCPILIDLGIAQASAGDVTASRATLLRAAETARRLELHEELVRAALAFGSKIPWGEGPLADPVQCELIEQALAVCDGTSKAAEAALLARLAAALRFSPDAERRESASRRALVLARESGDPPTLLVALNATHLTEHRPSTCEQRLAIAAEMVQIAERLGDREMAFQAYCWRSDDCVEVGDRTGIDIALSARERLATQLRQPHCLWANQVLRGGLATLAGSFADAEREIRDSLTLGRLVNPGAQLVHDILWTHLCLTWGRREPLEAALRVMIAHADAMPFLPALATTIARGASELGDREVARRYFEPAAAARFETLPDDQNWLMGTDNLAVACIFLEDRGNAAALYERLLPYEARVAAVAGIGGALDPVAHQLGGLAALLERHDAATRHFEDALAVGDRMRARPWVARIRFAYARTLLARAGAGDAERAATLLDEALTTARVLDMQMLLERVGAAREALQAVADRAPRRSADGHPGTHRSATTSLIAGDATFRCDGHYWTIEHAHGTLRVKDSKGLRYLALLFEHPGVELLALDLVARVSRPAAGARKRGVEGVDGAVDPIPVRSASVGAILDAPAKAAYRRRLEGLRAQLAESEGCNDLGRAERARAEIEMLAHQLRAATGLGGRDRQNGSDAERARFTVTKGIRAALREISALDPHLGHRIAACVKTGTYCSYAPPPSPRS